MPKPNNLSRSRAALDENNTLIAAIEMSLVSWLVGGQTPSAERHPLRKQYPDPDAPWPGSVGGAMKPCRPQDYAHRGGVRARPERLLACVLA